MEKSATLNLRVNPVIKRDAEAVLSRLGVPMSTAVDMFLNQIILTGGIPFMVSLPKKSFQVDAGKMTAKEIHEKMERGFEDYLNGETQNAAKAFEKFKENRG